MIYLLDANVLITARDQYYGFDMVAEFWTWLVHQGESGHVKMPIETMDEIQEGPPQHGKDPLYAWIKCADVGVALSLGEDVDVGLVRRVIDEGYATDMTDDQIAGLRADPFLIAHALADPGGRCVVSNEVSKPSRTGPRRKIPDACAVMGIACINTIQFARELRFSTAWKSCL